MTSHTGSVLHSAFLFVHYSVILSRIFTCSVWSDNLFFRMVEGILEQIEALEQKVETLSARAAIECHEAKKIVGGYSYTGVYGSSRRFESA